MPFGAYRPYHVAASKPGSVFSASGGTLGNCAIGCVDVSASAVSRPPAICGSAVLVWSNIASTWPAIRSFIAGAAPLYGTDTTSMPALLSNSAAIRCEVEPAPALPKLSLPGFFFAKAIRSSALLYGDDFGTSSTSGVSGKRNTGSKSFTGS